MRAILPIATSDKRLSSRVDDLKAIVQDNHWLVTDGIRAGEILNEVLADVSEGDRPRVAKEYVFSLEKANNTVTGILGVVPEDNRIEIRLIGDTTSAIKVTCSEIVEMFVKADQEAARKSGVHFGFNFPHIVGIVSKITKEQMWAGVVHPGSVWGYAFKEERGQAMVVFLGLIIFLAGFILTYPTIAHLVFGVTSENFEWLTGFIGRVSSAAIFASVVAWLNIQLRAQELRRSGTIIWRHV